MQNNFNENDLIRILTNPFYCLPKIDLVFTEDHEPIMDEGTFVGAGAKLIEEIGPEKYIKNLLENLKGNFVEDE